MDLCKRARALIGQGGAPIFVKGGLRGVGAGYRGLGSMRSRLEASNLQWEGRVGRVFVSPRPIAEPSPYLQNPYQLLNTLPCLPQCQISVQRISFQRRLFLDWLRRVTVPCGSWVLSLAK